MRKRRTGVPATRDSTKRATATAALARYAPARWRSGNKTAARRKLVGGGAPGVEKAPAQSVVIAFAMMIEDCHSDCTDVIAD